MMETDDDHNNNNNDDDTRNKKQCFSSVQLRRVWAPLLESTVALCPSMDLVTFSLRQQAQQQQHHHQQQSHAAAATAAASPLWLHRTLTFQKLATITVDETNSAAAAAAADAAAETLDEGKIDDTEDDSKMPASSSSSSTTDPSFARRPQQPQIQAAVWRPDGRWLAMVAHDPSSVLGGLYLTLFHVEEMVSSGTLSTGNIDAIPQQLGGTGTGGENAESSSFSSSLLSETSFPQLIGMSGNLIRIPLSSSATTAPSAVAAAASSTSSSSTTPVAASQVLGISWAHVGRWHPDLENDGNNEEEEMQHFYWKFRSRYVDRAPALLPPSEYHREHYGGMLGGEGAAAAASAGASGGSSSSTLHHHHHPSHGRGDGVLPNSNTPLSLLAVATDKGTVDCFLHGRYLIARDLPFDLVAQHDNNRTSTRSSSSSSVGSTRRQSVTMVSSNDLSHLILHSQGSPRVSLYSIPGIGREHYNLQTISALYASIMGHLYALPSSITQVAESWKSSLKPLDRKMDGLVRLLQNYGLLLSSPSGSDGTSAETPQEQSSIRAHFVQYILSGHTMRAADLSNAMDQFFTGVQMNDQLLTRMERSLTVAVANVESLLRKAVAAGQALVLETTELVGLGRFAPNLLDPTSAQRLQEYAQVLFVTLESALTCIIDARFRLRDWVAWLRATGSQIKARGTATNSVQRENARKRRVPDATVQRILRYLQGKKDSDGDNGDDMDSMAASKKNLSEALLGLNLTEHWETSSSSPLDGSPPTVKLGRPSSPRSVHSSSGASSLPSSVKSIPTIPFALNKTVEAAHVLFEHPRVYISKSIRRTDLCLPSSSSGNSSHNLPVALTTRLGAGGLSEDGLAYGQEAPTGFFAPKLAESVERDGQEDRQWTIVAQTFPPTMDQQQEGSIVSMYALPLAARGASTLDDDENENDYSTASSFDEDSSFVLSTTFSFPAGYRVCDLAFYGDNGKSSLFSGVDGGTGKERRQALAALVVRPEKSNGNGGGVVASAAAAATAPGSITASDASAYVLEAWLIDYEKSTWTDHDLVPSKNNIKTKQLNDADAVYTLPAPTIEEEDTTGTERSSTTTRIRAVPMPSWMDDDGDEQEEEEQDEDDKMHDNNSNSNSNKPILLYARTREMGRVDSLSVATSSRFMVSGSRGMGVVLTNQPGGTLLEVLDLEEHEECDDDDDDEDDDDDDEEMDDVETAAV